MARSTEPACKQCRREHQKLFLKGEKCYSEKCAITRETFARTAWRTSAETDRIRYAAS